MSKMPKLRKMYDLDNERDKEEVMRIIEAEPETGDSDVDSVCSEIEDNVEEINTVEDIIEGVDNEVIGEVLEFQQRPTYTSKNGMIWQLMHKQPEYFEIVAHYEIHDEWKHGFYFVKMFSNDKSSSTNSHTITKECINQIKEGSEEKEEEEGELNLFDSTDKESETEDNVEEIISDNENDGNQSTPVPQQPTAERAKNLTGLNRTVISAMEDVLGRKLESAPQIIATPPTLVKRERCYCCIQEATRKKIKSWHENRVVKDPSHLEAGTTLTLFQVEVVSMLLLKSFGVPLLNSNTNPVPYDCTHSRYLIAILCIFKVKEACKEDISYLQKTRTVPGTKIYSANFMRAGLRLRFRTQRYFNQQKGIN
ncbi:hypothetical protein C0J52_05859 [Blattella germanica]|nr:hypothetical protein C0J52_05859 [Blattella germanica]